MPTFEEKEAARQARVLAKAERAAERARAKTLAQLKVRAMTPIQYKHALKKLDIPIVSAGAVFGMSGRQAQRIAHEGPIPKLVSTVVRLLLDGKIQKEDLLS